MTLQPPHATVKLANLIRGQSALSGGSGIEDPDDPFDVGVVGFINYTTGSVAVYINASTTLSLDITCLNNVSVKVGDTVLLLKFGNSWIIIGTIGAPIKGVTNFFPTFTGFTLGNGSVRHCYYTYDGDYIEYSGEVLLGTTSAVAAIGDMRFSLPVAPLAVDPTTGFNLHQIGMAKALDATSTARVVGVAEIYPETFGNNIHFASDGQSMWEQNNPFIWAVNDTIQWWIKYRWR